MDYNTIWQDALTILENDCSSFTYRTVMMPLSVLGGDQHSIRLLCKDKIHLSFCQREKENIQKALNATTALRLLPEFSLDESVSAASEKQAAFGVGESSRPRNLNPQLNFDSFVVGKGNDFAYSVCRSVVQPGKNINNFNPLFIYGGSGLGKTHLIQAIGNYVVENAPKKRVVYVQCEAFLNEFIANIQTKTFETFRKKYRNCDYLLIDDIQFLQNKESTQEEFFHTFNALYENGSQIVLTCDKPPQQLNSMEDRLITRFRSGVMVDVKAPDYETRVAILNNLSSGNNISFPDDVTNYIASNISSNVRELEGAFKKVLAYTMLDGNVSLAMTMDVLHDMIYPQDPHAITPEIIINVICSYYSITPEDLFSSRRNKKISFPRQIAMYFFRTLLEMTYDQIGEFFKKKDHTTAMHNCDKIEGIISEKILPAYDEIEELRKKIEL